MHIRHISADEEVKRSAAMKPSSLSYINHAYILHSKAEEEWEGQQTQAVKESRALEKKAVVEAAIMTAMVK